MTPQQAIDARFITLEQVREYDCYAFLRKPEDRFYAIRASMQISRDGMYTNPSPRSPHKEGTPQHEFFFVGDEQVVTPLDFDNYEEEVRMLLTKLGGNPQMDVPAVAREFRAHMPIQVKYDPIPHTKEEALYRRMKLDKAA
jgi:hypothetical protein